MITKANMNRYNYLGRAMALPLAMIIFCAFSLNIHQRANQTSVTGGVAMDTVPISELVKTDPSSITAFSINNELAVLTLKNKQNITVTKKVFDEYMQLMVTQGDRQGPKTGAKPSEEKLFSRVQVEPAFPGGRPAWQRFLNKSFRYPQEAQDQEIQGTVLVQFKVDRQGNVSDVKAIAGPVTGGLREEAVRVITISGKWLPALVNGKKVTAYRKQPITFKLEAQ